MRKNNNKTPFSVWLVITAFFLGIFATGFLMTQRTEAGTTTWTFDTAGDFTYDSSIIEVTGGLAKLIIIDQIDNDNSATIGFAAGTHSDTQWDTTNLWLELDATGLTNGTGNYTSRIMNAGTSTAQWTAITWTPQMPYYKELPDNFTTETDYLAGNIGMGNNMLLFHLNETGANALEAGTISDTSGQSNNGTLYTGTDGISKSSSSAQLATSIQFDGNNDYIEVADSAGLDMGTAFTISAWVRSLNSTTTPNLYGTSNRHIVSKTEAGTTYQLGIDMDNTPYFGYEDIGTNLIYKYDNSAPDPSDGVSTNGRIPLGTNGTGDDTLVSESTVIKDGSTYKMWYAGWGGTTEMIYYATSPDGLTWTKYDNSIPVASDTIGTNGRIPIGTPGSGDSLHTHAPTVIKDGSTYKMWYSGANGVDEQIYYATSSDGLTWYKYDNSIPTDSDTTGTNGRIPQGTNGTGDDRYAMTPTVIKDGSTYKMWYAGFDGSKRRIYYATSPDGLTWTKYDNSIPDNSDTTGTNGRIPLGTNGTGDDDAYLLEPIVIKDGSTYKMWYTGYDGSEMRIYYATSPDGLTWTKYDNSIPDNSDTTGTNGRIPLGTNGTGDNSLVYAPSLIKEGSTYKMWYTGYLGTAYRIYYATLETGATSTSALSTSWNHLAGVIDETNIKLYINGNLDLSTTTAVTGVSNSGNLRIGELFDGAIDELAVFNRVLTATEIADIYKRGALKLRYQVRSCDDGACSGESFIGPDGTATDYYEELDNNATTTPSYSLTNLVANQYFQYKAFFDTASTTLSPELKSVTITPNHYDGSDSTVINSASTASYTELASFNETLGSNNAGDIRYQLSPDGVYWHYWNNSNWVSSTLNFDHANTSTLIHSNISTFDDDVGVGSLFIKAFFRSNLATQQVELDRISVAYNPTIQFASTVSSANEQSETITITINLSDTSAKDVTVDYTLSGTASGSGVDYTLNNGTATITAGTTATTLSLVIIDDTSPESNETVILTLSNPSGATLGNNTQHTHTINNSDIGGSGFGGQASAPPAPPPTTEEPVPGKIPTTGNFIVKINNDDQSTNSQFTTLSLNGGANAQKMAISNKPSFEGISQQIYQPEILNWNLCLGLAVSLCNQEGNTYSVYVIFYSSTGIPTNTITDSIIYNSTSTQPMPPLLPQPLPQLPIEEQIIIDQDIIIEPETEAPVSPNFEEESIVLETTGEQTEIISEPQFSQTGSEFISTAEEKAETQKITIANIIKKIEQKIPFTKNVNLFTQIIAIEVAATAIEIKKNIIESFTIINEFADLSKVETITKKVIAPATISASIIAIAPSFASVALPLTKYLFLQPLLFLGIRKRKKWGKIYNSLNKLPIQLATIRLINTQTNKVIRSRVSDEQGHYGFFVIPPGRYKLEISKKDFQYPSKFLQNENIDSRMTDLYHGEDIVVTDANANIALNIPLDPTEQKKIPTRIGLRKKILILQNFISSIGILVTLGTLYIINTWYIWIFLIIHIILYVSFLKFISPKKLKGWGVVYDGKEKKPIDKALVRLYNQQYNKQIDFQITDKKGRYAFLVGPSNYYTTFEKQDYEKRKINYPNNLSKAEEKILIDNNVDLFKKII